MSGQIASVTTPSGTTQYHYNNSGQLIDVIDGLAKTEYKYNVLGQIEQKILANGVVESYRYDSNNRLQQLEQKDRNYDRNGNLTKKTSGANVTTYNWDTQNRLNGATIVTATGTQQAIYKYDAFSLWA